MLTVSEAIKAILTEVRRLPAVRIELSSALGRVLAEDVIADLDSPPFDKSLMDGFAVRSSDLAGGTATLRVVAEIMAGQVADKSVGRNEAIRIMTGAPIPEGADSVVPVEETRLLGGPQSEVVIEGAARPGRSILKRGESTRRGQRVLAAGRQIRPQEIGALAELGRAEVQAFRAPRVAVLATGDELVDATCAPGPGQIRNSNEPMLAAQMRQIGADPVSLGIARDETADLREKISRGLTCDVLLLSGGVSAGKLDLVPAVLAELGARQVFHKVQVKPGQPIWFGVWDSIVSRPLVGWIERSEAHGAATRWASHGSTHPTGGRDTGPCYVFGLPGNPVSSMVCCELFVRTAIRRMMGVEPAEPAPIRARLTHEHFSSGSRPTYHPAHLQMTAEGALVKLVKWVGSADLAATVEANCMVLFPEGNRSYAAGTEMDVFLW